MVVVHLDYNVSSLALFCQKSIVRNPVMSGQVKARANELDKNVGVQICKICSQSLKSMKNLEEHMKTHLNPHFYCSDCGKTCDSKKSYRKLQTN